MWAIPASVEPRVDTGAAGHRPPHRLHTKEEEGDDDLTAPSAGFAPPSPPGQEAFIDAEVAGVAAIEAQFQAQMILLAVIEITSNDSNKCP